MKYKTLVRLGVKLLGLFLTASAIPGLIISCMVVGIDFWSTGALWGVSTLGLMFFAIQLLIGVYLFLSGAKWLVNRMVPSNRPYCPECAYELTGLPPAGVCPECGSTYRRDDAR